MRRRTCVWLSFRTSLERIAPESLTPALYSFVHGDMWLTYRVQVQDGVAGCRFKYVLPPSKVNAIWIRSPSKSQGETVIASLNHWPRPAAGAAPTRIRTPQVWPGRQGSALVPGTEPTRGFRQ